MSSTSNLRFLPSVCALAVALTCTANADQRRFAYTYETTTIPQGKWEFENWVTFERSPRHDSDFDTFTFRHEIEYGITSRFQLSLYVADWDFAPRGEEEEHEESATVESEGTTEVEEKEDEGHDEKESKPHRSARYKQTAVELVYNLTNPNTDFLGSALYLEGAIGDRVASLEAKLLLQKNFGPLTIAYNFVTEFEWEGAHLDAEEIAIEQTLGVSYQISPAFSVGGELVHEIEITDWNASNAEKAYLYVGPNVTYRHKYFFATATALWRTTDNPGASDMQARLIFGVDF